jgi:hypothetical protein
LTTPHQLYLVSIFLLLPPANAPSAGVRAGVVAQQDRAAAPASETQSPVESPRAADEPEGLIHLDVVVTDPMGKTVLGLKAADFTVLDGGRPEKIISFHAYGEGGGRPDPPVSITIVLDTLELPPDLTSRARVSVETFLRRNGGHLEQPISILMLTGNGLSQAGPSADGNALASSIAG